MKLGFNGASTMRADLREDIRAASEAGYDLIEFWAKKMIAYLSSHTLEDVKGLLKKAKVKPLAITSVEFITFNASWEKINTMNLIRRYAKIAETLKCPYIVLVPSPRPNGASDQDVFTESVTVLKGISDKFKGVTVEVAFEFLGFDWCSVSTLEQDVEIVKAVNRDNVGLILDTFHFYAGGSTLDSIKKADKRKIFVVHINDSENLPKRELQDCHRLYPGEGVIPLREIFARLKEIQYDGPVSIEMFRPEYWRLPAEEVARKGIETIKKFV